MTKEHWVEKALTNDALVAELLLRLKQSPYSDSLNSTPPSTSITQTKGFKLLPYWGHRKNRSKPTATITNVKNRIGKEQRGSPTTHLSWSGGGGSTSDGYDESSRPSDLSSGGRSVKIDEMGRMVDEERKKKASMAQSCRVEAEQERGFVLPDLNMMPNEEDLAVMMI